MLYFEKTELEAWLRQNPVKTRAQTEAEAQKYVLGTSREEVTMEAQHKVPVETTASWRDARLLVTDVFEAPP